MGFFNWLKSLFSEKKYNAKQAMHYIKKNYEKYKVIKPLDRKEFEELFLTLANNEISRLARLLKEDEINILAQRIRIKQFQKKENSKKITPLEKTAKEQWTETKINNFTKIIREKLNPSISSLTKSIDKIEYLEAKYYDALENNKDIWRNNKREISDLEEETRIYLNFLENTKNDLNPFYASNTLQLRLSQLISLWKETLKNLQQVRINNDPKVKAQLLSFINQSLRKEHNRITNYIINEIKLQKERIEDFYTEMPIESYEEQQFAAAK